MNKILLKTCTIKSTHYQSHTPSFPKIPTSLVTNQTHQAYENVTISYQLNNPLEIFIIFRHAPTLNILLSTFTFLDLKFQVTHIFQVHDNLCLLLCGGWGGGESTPRAPPPPPRMGNIRSQYVGPDLATKPCLDPQVLPYNTICPLPSRYFKGSLYFGNARTLRLLP